MNNICMTGESALMTDDDGAAKSPLDVSMAARQTQGDELRSGSRSGAARIAQRQPLRRGERRSKLARTRSMSFDLAALLTAATFALLPSAGES